MPKPQTCDATKGGCGNHFLIATNIFAADQSGPLEYDCPLICFGCNSLYKPVEDRGDGQPGYQRWSNITALTVLRTLQPPPGTFDDQ